MLTDYYADITGVGADSHCPDDQAAVDADVHYCGVPVGSVTLSPNQRGNLAPWGPDISCWADSKMADHLYEREQEDGLDKGEVIDMVVAAVVTALNNRWTEG